VKGWDSFNHLNLVMAIEARWSMVFSDEEYKTMDRVDRIVSAIRGKLTGANPKGPS
jgi:acyl carrier protein